MADGYGDPLGVVVRVGVVVVGGTLGVGGMLGVDSVVVVDLFGGVLVLVLGGGVRRGCGVLRVRCGFGLASGQVGGVRNVALAQAQDDERHQGGEQHKDA